jgi:hypothetical protein
MIKNPGASEVSAESHWLSLETRFRRDEIQSEQDVIDAQVLSPLVRSWIDRYNLVGERGEYLWKWCQFGLKAIQFPGVLPEFQSHLIDTKLLAVVLGVLLDDIADHWQDDNFLELLIRGVENSAARSLLDLGEGQKAYAKLTWEIWDEFNARATAYPAYSEFSRLLEFDNRQVLNTMRFSCLINRNVALLNMEEHDVYTPHNMQMISFATLDLMCLPALDRQELGRIRAAMWHAQCMGRIGNLVSTWERELKDGDYSSGVFAVLTERFPDLTQKMLLDKTDAIHSALIEEDIESTFLSMWEHHRECFRARLGMIHSVDMGQVLAGLDQLLRMELGSRGRK